MRVEMGVEPGATVKCQVSERVNAREWWRRGNGYTVKQRRQRRSGITTMNRTRNERQNVCGRSGTVYGVTTVRGTV